MNTITLSFTEEEVIGLCGQSSDFTHCIVKRLLALQNQNSARQKSEPEMISGLKTYIKEHFNKQSSFILAIKHVRTWTKENEGWLSNETFTELYSLSGAKKFVESILY